MDFSQFGKEELRGTEELRGMRELRVTEGLRDALGTSFEPAWSCLSALLEWPQFLSLEQREELEALVGSDWSGLGVDIERCRAWSTRAGTLLRAIDRTWRGALSDAQWTALLSQARIAVDEAQVAARHIKLSGHALDLGSQFTSVGVPEGPGSSTPGILIQPPQGPDKSMRDTRILDGFMKTPEGADQWIRHDDLDSLPKIPEAPEKIRPPRASDQTLRRMKGLSGR